MDNKTDEADDKATSVTTDTKPLEDKNVNIERAIEDEPKSNKYFAIIVAIVIVSFAGIIAYVYLNSGSNSGKLTIEDLHELNAKGKLSPERGYIYNGFSFVNFDGLWWTEVQVSGKLYKVPLHFGPKDVENVTVTGNLNLIKFNNGTQVFIVLNPTNSSEWVALSASEISQNIVSVVKRQPIGACDRNETEMCANRPILTCASNKPMIYILSDGKASIDKNESCITLSGDKYEVVRATDRLLLEWYNVYG